MKLILLVWLAGILGCLIMKKIQPETFKPYLVYVIAICLIVTALITYFSMA